MAGFRRKKWTLNKTTAGREEWYDLSKHQKYFSEQFYRTFL